MPQMQLPIFSEGVNPITNDVGYEKKENTMVYYCGTMPVFSHSVDDLDSFRMIVSQLYVNGTVHQANLTRAFQIKPLALKRWVKRYRADGARAFFQSRPSGSKPKILTPEVRARVQDRLDQGQSLSQIAAELVLNYDAVRKAVADGRLKRAVKKRRGPGCRAEPGAKPGRGARGADEQKPTQCPGRRGPHGRGHDQRVGPGDGQRGTAAGWSLRAFRAL